MLKNLTGTLLLQALQVDSTLTPETQFLMYSQLFPKIQLKIWRALNASMMETINGKYIRISITTPTTQAGTVGGGTQLPSQSVQSNLLALKELQQFDINLAFSKRQRFNNVGNTERQSLYHCLFKLEEARACKFIHSKTKKSSLIWIIYVYPMKFYSSQHTYLFLTLNF